MWTTLRPTIRCLYHWPANEVDSAWDDQPLTYTLKAKKSLFEPSFRALRGNICTPSMARWKAHGRLYIRRNWTFFRYFLCRNHTITKFATFVHVVWGNLCWKFCYKRTTFDKITVKILKLTMDPSSRTGQWLPSVLILRDLWFLDIFLTILLTWFRQLSMNNAWWHACSYLNGRRACGKYRKLHCVSNYTVSQKTSHL